MKLTALPQAQILWFLGPDESYLSSFGETAQLGHGDPALSRVFGVQHWAGFYRALHEMARIQQVGRIGAGSGGNTNNFSSKQTSTYEKKKKYPPITAITAITATYCPHQTNWFLDIYIYKSILRGSFHHSVFQ